MSEEKKIDEVEESSVAPIAAALGVALAGLGIVTHWSLSLCGVLVFAIGIAIWARSGVEEEAAGSHGDASGSA